MSTQYQKNTLASYRKYLQVTKSRPLVQASVYAVLSLTLIVVLINWALRPTLITVSGLIGDLSQNKNISDRMSIKINQIVVANRLMNEQTEKIALLDQAIPTTKIYALWLKKIEDLATNHRLNLETFSLTKNVYTLSVSGQTTDVYAFVRDFSTTLRLSSIKKMTVSFTTNKDKENITKLELGGVLP